MKKILDHPKDIFFLKIDEINSLVNKKKYNNIKDVKTRRIKYQFLFDKNDENYRQINSNKEYKGECCVEGIVKGRINKISKIGDLDKIKDGDILVCKYIRPAWSYIFPRLNGVIIESGGLLSHGATLLREHNTSSVINVKNIFNSIPQHSEVIMDCNRGVVKIL